MTTPVGIAWSPSDFHVRPTVKSLSPTSGHPGTIVTITGTAFTGATKVLFNGTTGPVKVVTPGGKASSGTKFTVT